MHRSFLHPNATPSSISGHINRQLEEVNAEEQAKLAGLSYVNLHLSPADLNVISLFTEDEARQAEGIPFSKDHTTIRVATTNPGNPLLQQKMEELAKRFTVKMYVTSRAGFLYALNFYKHVVTPPAHVSEEVRLDSAVSYVAKVKQISAGGAETTVGEVVDAAFGLAMEIGASDIHIEPEGALVRIRFRVDGVLQDLLRIPTTMQRTLLSRLKILSHLKINVENVPQDGRITFFWGKDPVDVRVSTLPSAYGEGVVMRLLGVGAISLHVSDLGLIGRSKEIVEAELQKPNGMIVTTGPTGSGKTTTLYAFLNELNDPGVKIITIEDPVEYKLQGVQQTPIDHSVDFSFAKALRAILRQDPDVVMVGEIRDAETADTALQASLTGHVVLSTLHTNDAFGAVPRLVTMGVKPFVIAPGLNAVIAQRLVRRLCAVCKTAVVLPTAMQQTVDRILTALPEAAHATIPADRTFFHAPGCDACHNLGYKGRIGIYEVIQVNAVVKEMILKEATMGELKAQAITDGTVTMVQDGLLKALQGITDVEEVFRVAGE
ncbi:MAG: type II/IV secretion system protein [Candidatus Doudnabacteria bacterium]|nr:type II/IV secretion system protein [Candidatus Doudnabacteria bacterium]